MGTTRSKALILGMLTLNHLQVATRSGLDCEDLLLTIGGKSKNQGVQPKCFHGKIDEPLAEDVALRARLAS